CANQVLDGATLACSVGDPLEGGPRFRFREQTRARIALALTFAADDLRARRPRVGRRLLRPASAIVSRACAGTTAARPLRSSARLSLGRSLSEQCSAGGVSDQPRTERSHAR